MIQVQKAGKEQLEDLISLFDAYRVFYRKESDVAQARKFLTERIENKESVIFMAYSTEGKPMGFTQLYPLFSSTRMKKLWLLNDLYVKPEARRMGVAQKLIEEAKNLALESSACGLILETEKSNFEGNMLYPKVGFKLSEHSNYYEWSI